MDYHKKVQRFIDTTNHIEPDKVPILGIFGTWTWEYGGLKASDAMKDVAKEMQAYKKVICDFPVDGLYYIGEGRSMEMYDCLGNNAYFISEDGSTLQHREISMMEADEYDMLSENFREYTYNILLKKKYPELNVSDEHSRAKITESVTQMFKEWDRCELRMEYAREFCMPITSGIFTFAPVDYLFDFYRGFRGINLDIKRNPEKIVEAADKLTDIIIENFKYTNLPQGYPFCWTPLHLPAFISAKLFEKIYWPSFKKLYDFLFANGVKVMFYTEGDWSHLYDYINELPRDKVICLMEKDDITVAKKEIGSNVTIAGGLDTEYLKYATKQESVDAAKRIIDACAPGGGFILSTNKILVSKNDVNPDNFKAAIATANEYGKYR